jgi:hypothetical protein
MPLKSGPFVTWLLKNDCQLLGDALGLHLDDVTEIFGVARPAEYVPFLTDEIGLPDNHIPSNDSPPPKKKKDQNTDCLQMRSLGQSLRLDSPASSPTGSMHFPAHTPASSASCSSLNLQSAPFTFLMWSHLLSVAFLVLVLHAVHLRTGDIMLSFTPLSCVLLLLRQRLRC